MLSDEIMFKENYLKNTKKLYVCGPTVYSDSHIGHARCYMVVDILHRIMLNISNENVFMVMNITDIDNKIIKKAKDTNTPWIDVSRTYEKAFFDSMAKLNIQKPNIVIRVSEVIPQIIAYIQRIMDNGFAYPTEDGSIYFDSETYEKAGYNFGNNDVDVEEHCSKVDVKVILQKRNRRDFALWKGRAKNDVGFDADFLYNGVNIKTYGVPGWHIECSCMIDETLGSNLDLHMGGIDLKFPHHHNENIQANAYYHPLYLSINSSLPSSKMNFPESNKKWCETFMHVGHVCVNGKKMAKSLGNYVSIDDALKEIDANQLRWMFISHKWDEPLEYSDETILHAKTYDTTVKNFLNRIVNYPFNQYDVRYQHKEFSLEEYFDNAKSSIILSLVSFNLETASKAISELIAKTNAYINMEHANEHIVKKIYIWIRNILIILGFNYGTNHWTKESEIMSVLIGTRTSLRNLTRDKNMPMEFKKKIFEILDAERNTKLKEIGIILQDTKDSSSWYAEK